MADFCLSSLAMCSFSLFLTAPLKRVQVMDLSGIASTSFSLRVHGDRPEHDVGHLGHAEDLLVDVEEGDIAASATGSPILRYLDLCHVLLHLAFASWIYSSLIGFGPMLS